MREMSLLLIVCVVVVGCFSGCGGSSAAENPPVQAEVVVESDGMPTTDLPVDRLKAATVKKPLVISLPTHTGGKVLTSIYVKPLTKGLSELHIIPLAKPDEEGIFQMKSGVSGLTVTALNKDGSPALDKDKRPVQVTSTWVDMLKRTYVDGRQQTSQEKIGSIGWKLLVIAIPLWLGGKVLAILASVTAAGLGALAAIAGAVIVVGIIMFAGSTLVNALKKFLPDSWVPELSKLQEWLGEIWDQGKSWLKDFLDQQSQSRTPRASSGFVRKFIFT